MKRMDSQKYISVEIKILGLAHGEYLNHISGVTVPEGTSLKKLPKIALKQGVIDKKYYRIIKGLKPPLSLIINGEQLSDLKDRKYTLNSGDSITIYTPLSGG